MERREFLWKQQEKKDQATAKRLARRMDIIRKVQDSGGLCLTTTAVNRLLRQKSKPKEQVGCSSSPNSVPLCRSWIERQAVVITKLRLNDIKLNLCQYLDNAAHKPADPPAPAVFPDIELENHPCCRDHQPWHLQH